jgi:hypothetical protein
MSRNYYFTVCAVFVLLALLGGRALALASETTQSPSAARDKVSSYEVFNKSKKRDNSKIQYMQSEISLRNDDVNRAVSMGRRAVELDPNDIDARVALGEALYQKIKKAKKKVTPEVYNECVKTWLMVLRNIVGDEANMGYKGISIPLVERFYEDEDRTILARTRLTAVCGRVPKFWETNKKFLDKVLLPEASTSVAGTVISGSNAGDSTRDKNSQ